ncbi:MAG: SRPBCC family protein [Haloarculaceae archaeon]
MATYSRETRVAAPLSEVWEFHSRVSGLVDLTPGFLNLEIERIVGPDGETLPEASVLETGTRIESSVRPFGIGPRQEWTSVIVEREEGEGSAHFVDTMAEGPFPEWRHTHRFFGADGETVVSDRIEYRLPGGELGEFASRFAAVGFEPMFRYRHRRTRELLGGG